MSDEDYANAKEEVVAALVAFLQAGDAIGKSQAEMAGEFMAAFTQAAEQAQS